MLAAPIVSTRPELAHPLGEWCTIGDNFAALRQEIRRRHADDLTEIVSPDQRVARLILGRSFGSGYLEFLSLGDDLSAIISDGSFRHAQPFKLFGQEWLRFHFRISGQNSLLFGDKIQYNLTGPLAQVLLLPEDVLHTDYIGGEHGMQMLSIYCGRRTLTEALGVEPDRLPGMLSRYVAGGEVTFAPDHLRYSRDVYEALAALFRAPVTGGVRPAYIKTKVLEIICLFISDLYTDGASDGTLCARDRERLVEVRDRISQAPSEAWRIRDLARMVGMNRNKLTRGFRDMFGMSIFEHQRRARLTLAMRLLCEEGLPISQVACDVGYAHQSTFTSAFRKQFGVSPARYRTGEAGK